MYRQTTVVVVSALVLFTQPALADLVTADNIGGAPQSSGFFIGIGFAGSSGFTNEAAAQEFTALVDGTVTTLLATVDRWQADDVPLEVAIHAKSGGTVGALLGQVDFPSAEVPQGLGAHPYDLSSAAIDLTAGESYFAVFTVDTPISGSTRYRALRAANPAMWFGIEPMFSRDGGGTWEQTQSDPEIGLTVYVVPEPSTMLMVGACLVIVSGRRCRRRLT